MLDRTLLLTRPRALLLVALAWAAIYLPALGSLEIKGEEGRRILPAVTMLSSGDWIVPHIGGEAYLSKPPLLNWLVALSFQITGRQNEWAARAPTVLAVLALGLGLAWRGGAWLGPGGGLVAALLTLTSVGLMEKGRLAELEGLYVTCFGLALVDWLASWRTGANAWRLWLGPALPLGLGLLTKGPLCLVYYYVIVAAVLWRAGRLRELRQPAQWVGLALALLIFAAWAVPYWQQAPHGKVGSAWTAQFTGRMQAGEEFRFKNWIQNIPRGLFLFVPWVVFLPLVWQNQPKTALAEQSPADFAILRGMRWALAACFLVVLLLPGGLPRYTLPLLVPAALLVAQVGVLRWPSAGVRGFSLPVAALLAAAVMAVITACYALAIPWLQGGQNLRVAARRLDAASAHQAIYALEPGYQPFLFYLQPPPRYVASVEQLPVGADEFLLVKNEGFNPATARLAARGIVWENVLTLDEKNRGRYVLLHLSGGKDGSVSPDPRAGR